MFPNNPSVTRSDDQSLQQLKVVRELYQQVVLNEKQPQKIPQVDEQLKDEQLKDAQQQKLSQAKEHFKQELYKQQHLFSQFREELLRSRSATQERIQLQSLVEKQIQKLLEKLQVGLRSISPLQKELQRGISETDKNFLLGSLFGNELKKQIYIDIIFRQLEPEMQEKSLVKKLVLLHEQSVYENQLVHVFLYEKRCQLQLLVEDEFLRYMHYSKEEQRLQKLVAEEQLEEQLKFEEQFQLQLQLLQVKIYEQQLFNEKLVQQILLIAKQLRKQSPKQLPVSVKDLKEASERGHFATTEDSVNEETDFCPLFLYLDLDESVEFRLDTIHSYTKTALKAYGYNRTILSKNNKPPAEKLDFDEKSESPPIGEDQPSQLSLGGGQLQKQSVGEGLFPVSVKDLKKASKRSFATTEGSRNDESPSLNLDESARPPAKKLDFDEKSKSPPIASDSIFAEGLLGYPGCEDVPCEENCKMCPPPDFSATLSEFLSHKLEDALNESNVEEVVEEESREIVEEESEEVIEDESMINEDDVESKSEIVQSESEEAESEEVESESEELESESESESEELESESDEVESESEEAESESEEAESESEEVESESDEVESESEEAESRSC